VKQAITINGKVFQVDEAVASAINEMSPSSCRSSDHRLAFICRGKILTRKRSNHDH
jgi:hypothetical protein